MHRKKLLELLNQYQTSSHEEEASLNKLKQFVQTTPDCFERTHLSGHITGSAWLISPDGKKALLTHHKKLQKWLQLGGHSDGDADTLNVALREAQEESGIEDIKILSSEIFDIDVHKIPARKDEPEHYHYDVRFLLQAQSESFNVSDESHDLAWKSFDELESMSLEQSMRRMVTKWKQNYSTQTSSRA